MTPSPITGAEGNREFFLHLAPRLQLGPDRGSAQQKVLRGGCAVPCFMPVATARKIEALRADFRSAAQVADLLGVAGRGSPPGCVAPGSIRSMPNGSILSCGRICCASTTAMRPCPGCSDQPRLGDRRPIDLVRAGRTEELMRAIRAERSDSFA